MGRRARVAAALGAAVVLVAAVLTLRSATDDGLDRLLREPAPRVVDRSAAGIVTLPDPGPPPEGPGAVRIRADAHPVALSWGDGLPGGPEPAGAAGYQVRWPGGQRVVAEPGVELPGLAPGQAHRVRIHSIDEVGRRSPPVSGVPSGQPDTGWRQRYSFFDGFDGSPVPDPARWRITAAGEFCLRAGAGRSAEAGRLVVALDCGSTPHSLVPAVPLRLATAPDGELGRVAVVTDAAGSGATLTIDLVPGPVDAVGSDPGATDPPARSGTAVRDPALPPGTLRVLVGEAAPIIVTGPGVPRTGIDPAPLAAPARQAPGVTHRFEVVLRTDGLVVLRDGIPVAAADVAAPWRRATVLIGLAGPPGGRARMLLDAVGISGGAAPEPVVAVRSVVTPLRVVHPGTATERPPGPARAGSAQLRVLLRPDSGEPLGQITAVVGDTRVPVRPAVAGTMPQPGALFPMVAELPSEAVGGRTPRVVPAGERAAGTEVVAGSMLFDRPPSTRAPAPIHRPQPAPTQPRAPAVRITALDAAGHPPDPGRPLSRGRMLLDVRLDGAAAQRTGRLSGLAGIELLLDGERIAALPTARDVPAVGGRHRFGVDTSGLAPGRHTVVVRAIPADPGVEPRREEITVTVR
ncbi:MAG: hypothetical protein GEV09_23865 [Pseudonocardiaceae bacterium]|nr:hypothetical protein [Pseudonocardiaceae bacterium]